MNVFNKLVRLGQSTGRAIPGGPDRWHAAAGRKGVDARNKSAPNIAGRVLAIHGSADTVTPKPMMELTCTA